MCRGRAGLRRWEARPTPHGRENDGARRGTIRLVPPRSRRRRPQRPLVQPPAEPLPAVPDARDGLTRLERVILVELSRLEAERGGGSVPTAMLYGRVVSHLNVSVEEFQAVLSRLVGR